MSGSTERASTSPIEQQIKLERQAKAALRLPAGGYAALATYLGGNDAVINDRAFREAVLGGGEARWSSLAQEYRGAGRR